jgi:hypothetical protein
MAIPKTEVDRRMDRIEKAISTMATWLVEAKIGLSVHDAESIEKILKGKDGSDNRPSTAPEDSSE